MKCIRSGEEQNEKKDFHKRLENKMRCVQGGKNDEEENRMSSPNNHTESELLIPHVNSIEDGTEEISETITTNTIFYKDDGNVRKIAIIAIDTDTTNDRNNNPEINKVSSCPNFRLSPGALSTSLDRQSIQDTVLSESSELVERERESPDNLDNHKVVSILSPSTLSTSLDHQSNQNTPSSESLVIHSTEKESPDNFVDKNSESPRRKFSLSPNRSSVRRKLSQMMKLPLRRISSSINISGGGDSGENLEGSYLQKSPESSPISPQGSLLTPSTVSSTTMVVKCSQVENGKYEKEELNEETGLQRTKKKQSLTRRFSLSPMNPRKKISQLLSVVPTPSSLHRRNSFSNVEALQPRRSRFSSYSPPSSPSAKSTPCSPNHGSYRITSTSHSSPRPPSTPPDQSNQNVSLSLSLQLAVEGGSKSRDLDGVLDLDKDSASIIKRERRWSSRRNNKKKRKKSSDSIVQSMEPEDGFEGEDSIDDEEVRPYSCFFLLKFLYCFIIKLTLFCLC